MDQVIDLSGILFKDIVLYNKILDAYYAKLGETTLVSSISCNIQIGGLVLKNSNNCVINVVNRCSTNSSLSLNVLLETIIENLEFVSDDIRNRIEKNLGIILKPNQDQSKSQLMQRCNVSSEVTNTIQVQNLLIKNCTSERLLNFDFYNTGSAQANCGIVELLRALSDKNVKEEKDEAELASRFEFILNKVIGLNLTDFLYIVGIIFFVLLLILLISSTSFRQKVIFMFSRNLKKIEKKIQLIKIPVLQE